MMGDGGMGWGIVMMVAMVAFVVLVVAGVIWLIRMQLRERSGPGRDQGDRPDALQALERRYAEGEIEVEEYRERRSILERGR